MGGTSKNRSQVAADRWREDLANGAPDALDRLTAHDKKSMGLDPNADINRPLTSQELDKLFQPSAPYSGTGLSPEQEERAADGRPGEHAQDLNVKPANQTEVDLVVELDRIQRNHKPPPGYTGPPFPIRNLADLRIELYGDPTKPIDASVSPDVIAALLYGDDYQSPRPSAPDSISDAVAAVPPSPTLHDVTPATREDLEPGTTLKDVARDRLGPDATEKEVLDEAGRIASQNPDRYAPGSTVYVDVPIPDTGQPLVVDPGTTLDAAARARLGADATEDQVREEMERIVAANPLRFPAGTPVDPYAPIPDAGRPLVLPPDVPAEQAHEQVMLDQFARDTAEALVDRHDMLNPPPPADGAPEGGSEDSLPGNILPKSCSA